MVLLAVIGVTAFVFALAELPSSSRGAPLWSYCTSDASNLTANGSMAGGHYTSFGVVADSWEPFSFTGIAPSFDHATNEQIDPNGSQYIYAQNQTFDAGIYQTDSNLNQGSLYRVWLGYALAAIDFGDGQNARTNHIGRQVGINLSGGTDPRSPDVVWSPVYYDGIAALNIPALSMTFRAQTSRVTIFLRAINTDSAGLAKVWFDSVCMEPTSTAPTPSAPQLRAAATSRVEPSSPPLASGPAATSRDEPPPPPVVGGTIYLPVISRQCAPPTVLANLNVGWHPKGVAGDSATNRVYVNLLDASAVTFIDANTLATLGTWWLNDAGQGRGIAAYNGTVFAALRETASLVLMNGLTGAYKSRAIVGARPYGVGNSNGRIWVADSGSGSVSVLDTLGNLVGTDSAGNTPALVAPAVGRAFVSMLGGGVTDVSDNGSTLNHFDTGAGSFGVAFDPLTDQLFVSNRNTNQIMSLNASTGEVLRTVTLDQAPFALALNLDTRRLFAVLANSNQLDVRDATTLDRVELLSIGSQGTSGGDGIAILNGRVYVSNFAQGTLSVVGDTCQ